MAAYATAMIRRIRSMFRDEEDGWTFPDGRYGELTGLAIGLPLFAWHATASTGLSPVEERWLAVIAGGLCGLLYTGRYRDRLLERVPDGTCSVITSFLSGGFLLTILEIVHLAAPVVAFVLAAGVIVLGVYVVRLASPMHGGLEPLPRGVDPPDVDDASPLRRRAIGKTEP